MGSEAQLWRTQCSVHTTAHEQEVREWSQGSGGPRVRRFWSFFVLFHWVAPCSLALALHPQNGDKYLLLSNSEWEEARIPERESFGRRYSKLCNHLVSIPSKATIAETWDADSEVLFNFKCHQRHSGGAQWGDQREGRENQLPQSGFGVLVSERWVSNDNRDRLRFQFLFSGTLPVWVWAGHLIFLTLLIVCAQEYCGSYLMMSS